VLAKNAASARVHYDFVDVENIPFTGNDISSIDCFHPSAQGQELLADFVWTAGAFAP